MRKAPVLVLGLLATTGHAFKATILADTNRDGKVDTTGDSDVQGKTLWTEQRGAIFMPNIADSNRRCARPPPPSLFGVERERCHDATDNKLRNPKYLAPLRTLPSPDLSDFADATITVSSKYASKKVRIFHKAAENNWTYVGKDHVFHVADVRAGLELGIDARDVRRPKGWDGIVTVNFTLIDHGNSSSDTVALRVAPLLIPHTLRELEQMWVATHPELPQREIYAQRLERFSIEHGLERSVNRLGEVFGWAHDYFKAGFTSMPGPDGPISLRVYLRACLLGHAGPKVFSDLRSGSAGAVKHGRRKELDSDRMGNLEVIPPHSHNGRTYPAGRIVMGYGLKISHQKKPNILKFLQAQETQQPLLLAHNFLYYGQIAEYMQFVPANTPRGWTMAVADPVLGLSLIQKAQTDGYGHLPAVSRTRMRGDAVDNCDSVNIDMLLTMTALPEINDWCSRKIAHNVDIIKNETGITEDEIIRVPALFFAYAGTTKPKYVYCNGKYVSHPEDLQKLEPSRFPSYPGLIGWTSFINPWKPPWPSKAIYPTATTGMYFGDGQYLSPDPFGPKINGIDIFAKATRDAYAMAGLNVTFFENWLAHHELGGGLQRATNAARDIHEKWW